MDVLLSPGEIRFLPSMALSVSVAGAIDIGRARQFCVHAAETSRYLAFAKARMPGNELRTGLLALALPAFTARTPCFQFFVGDA
jgi:hypothetical protein